MAKLLKEDKWDASKTELGWCLNSHLKYICPPPPIVDIGLSRDDSGHLNWSFNPENFLEPTEVGLYELCIFLDKSMEHYVNSDGTILAHMTILTHTNLAWSMNNQLDSETVHKVMWKIMKMKGLHRICQATTR